MPLLAESLSHLDAYSDDLYGTLVLPCLATLAMGDALSPEIAQSAHHTLLQRECGAMSHEHVVASRCRMPRGPLYETLTYDDHATLCKVSASTELRPDLDIFARCDLAYPR
eukprot:6274831-Amphidinium_carterae.1